MKLHRYVDDQRLHIVTKDVISLSISVLLLFRHYISHKITFGAPSSGGVLCSACGAFIIILNEIFVVLPSMADTRIMSLSTSSSSAASHFWFPINNFEGMHQYHSIIQSLQKRRA